MERVIASHRLSGPPDALQHLGFIRLHRDFHPQRILRIRSPRCRAGLE